MDAHLIRTVAQLSAVQLNSLTQMEKKKSSQSKLKAIKVALSKLEKKGKHNLVTDLKEIYFFGLGKHQ